MAMNNMNPAPLDEYNICQLHFKEVPKGEICPKCVIGDKRIYEINQTNIKLLYSSIAAWGVPIENYDIWLNKSGFRKLKNE